MKWRRLLNGGRQLQVTDDPVHHGMLREESDNLYPPAAVGAEERFHFISARHAPSQLEILWKTSALSIPPSVIRK
jgi:hypothetical protein